MSNIEAIDALLAEYGEPTVELEDWELPWFDAKVALDDGRRFLVHADQRDQRRALQTLGIDAPSEGTALAYATCVSWAFLTRKARVAMDWHTFEDACAFVAMQAPAPVDPTGTGGAP
jgi:hypothetical protein